MATEWDDLLTVAEVQNAALSSSGAATDNPNSVVEGAIRDAQRRITSYLGQDPIVHRLKQNVRAYEWTQDPSDPNDDYRAWARHKPIVEVQSPTDISIRHDNQQFLINSPDDEQIDYHAGWIRSDQELGDVDGTNSGTLTDLTTEPDTLPNDIRRTGILITLFYIGTSEHGAGIGQITHSVGAGGTITVDGPDPSFEARQLRRIQTYKTKKV